MCRSIGNPDYADRLYFDFEKSVIKNHYRGLRANFHLLFHWKVTKAGKANHHAQFRSDFSEKAANNGHMEM